MFRIFLKCIKILFYKLGGGLAEFMSPNFPNSHGIVERFLLLAKETWLQSCMNN